eukprot:CAMPEP_0177779780 /NCGR_PEP_ID=MMETSP0491_2-20121128/16811_1 /TAXON_ID=63592 /ORGANISM="Tetraselmis chuii, Strain PLY429" /LENGTH=233 /DNA_ID=CAMNT_0019299425 /DNA_START=65 /DNA_END=766 /DNA_ORIENTATION=+
MALLGAARQNSNCLDSVRMRNRLCFFSTVTSSSSLSAAKRIAPGSVHEARGRILGLQVVDATALGEVEPPDDAKGAVRFNIAPVKQTGGSRPRRRTCRRCSGTTKVACKDCKGAGQLPRGGYNKKNPIIMDKIIGSKWTAMERTFGWRHFTATQKRKEGKDVYVLLVATCDPATRLWVNVENLKDRQRFAAGWLQKVQLNEVDTAGAQCRSCSGTGEAACPLCSCLAGALVEM